MRLQLLAVLVVILPAALSAPQELSSDVFNVKEDVSQKSLQINGTLDDFLKESSTFNATDGSPIPDLYNHTVPSRNLSARERLVWTISNFGVAFKAVWTRLADENKLNITHLRLYNDKGFRPLTRYHIFRRKRHVHDITQEGTADDGNVSHHQMDMANESRDYVSSGSGWEPEVMKDGSGLLAAFFNITVINISIADKITAPATSDSASGTSLTTQDSMLQGGLSTGNPTTEAAFGAAKDTSPRATESTTTETTTMGSTTDMTTTQITISTENTMIFKRDINDDDDDDKDDKNEDKKHDDDNKDYKK